MTSGLEGAVVAAVAVAVVVYGLTGSARTGRVGGARVVGSRSWLSRPSTSRPSPPGRVRPRSVRPEGGAARAGAQWARQADLRPLLVRGLVPGRLVLGAPAGRGRRRALMVATEPAQSVAVVGPTQSGKTTALAVPAILAWDGPVVAASVKTDLVRDTLSWRERRGTVWCFDPVGSTGLAQSPWSPLTVARTWAGARRIAAALTEVTRGDGTTADGDFWYATAAKLLAPLLFAASSCGATMRDVVRWVDTQETTEVLGALEAAGVPEALQAAQATWLRDDRQRSAVYTTAETVLEPFAEPDAAPANRPLGPEIDPGGLLLGPHTLYICAPAHDQRRLRPMFVAVVRQVLDAAFVRSSRLGRPLDPPLLVVLDEAANIAPLPDLDGLAATCAGHGVQLVTVWQDLAQVRARYGERAATVVNNHRARLFLSGTADPGTLDLASHLVGDEELAVPSVTLGAAGERTVTTSPVMRRLLPPDAVRRMAPGSGVLVYGWLPPARVTLRPWFADPVLVTRGPRPDGGSGAGRGGGRGRRVGRGRGGHRSSRGTAGRPEPGPLQSCT